MTLKKIVSFGFKYHGQRRMPPVGAVVIDVRRAFWNPYRERRLRPLRGTDPDVQAMIMQTPNFLLKYQHLKAQVTAPGVEEAWIGCQGGKHRSVFLVDALARELGVAGEHRDIHQP